MKLYRCFWDNNYITYNEIIITAWRDPGFFFYKIIKRWKKTFTRKTAIKTGTII
ncbi:hypothetical protein M2448_003865 [Dysgonomonas sp. PF1-14]|nr:hypothetical protein [Dysgonomonas sp. PF1-14]